MKNWKWWAFLLVGTSLCLCAPTAFAAESAGLHTQLPGAELWQPYLDQSPADALQVAEDPWSVLQSFCTSSLFQTLRESIRGYAALLLFLLLSAIVSLFLGEEGDHSWCDLVCAGGCGILLWEPLLEIARQLCAQIESWNRFLSGFLPVYAGVLIMGGETSAGAATSGFFLTLLCLLAQALTAFVPPILECFLASVSYTHLDVYKRQGHGRRTEDGRVLSGGAGFAPMAGKAAGAAPIRRRRDCT